MPVTQSLEFGYTTGQTLTAKLFATGSDTVTATASSVTEQTNRKGRYYAVFTDVAAADYLLVYFLGGSGAGSEYYTLTLDTATFTPWSEIKAATPAQVSAAVGDESLLLDIKNKTDLITSQSANQQALATTTKEIVRGDSYDGTANPKLAFVVSIDYTGFTGTFTIRHRVTDAVLCSATATVISSTLIEVTLTTTDTAFALLVDATEFGPHPFDIKMVSGSSERQAAQGDAVIYRDQSR